MLEKVCTKCKKLLPITEYNVFKDKKVRSECKECARAMCRAYKARNREKIAAYNKTYKAENADDISVYNNKYNKENRAAIQTRQTRTRRERKATDPNFKLTIDLRTKLYEYIRSKGRESKSIEKLLGIKWQYFEIWLIYQFDSEMSFENYGHYWTIDHVKPCCTFNILEEKQKLECFNWSNLRPMLKLENNKKTGKTLPKVIESHTFEIVDFVNLQLESNNDIYLETYI